MIAIASLLAAATAPSLAIAPVVDLAPFVTEASQRTGVPEAIIWAVMRAESNHQSHAISVKGAAGLMQLMPTTWRILRDRLGLGTDPFDPHDNIVAGAFYLRFLYDRYGLKGMFSAYNAGPGRYEAYRDLGQPLPAETLAYVAAIAGKLAGSYTKFANPADVQKLVPWTEAALFVASQDGSPNSESPFASTSDPFVTLPSTSTNASPE